MKPQTLFAFLLFIGLLSHPRVEAQHSIYSCAADHDHSLLPVGYEAPIWKTVLENGDELVAELQQIDPLGAPIDTPWTVHLNELPVYSLPTADYGTTLGLVQQSTPILGGFHVVKQTDEEWLRFDFNGQEAWVSSTGVNRVHPINLANLEKAPNLPIGEEIINRWWGIPISYEPNDLMQIPSDYTDSKDDHDYFLRREAAVAAMEMMDAAKAEGVIFYISSPYRSGETQQRIYTRNVKRAGKKQRFSAPPGHSEHQLGLTIDFSSPDTKRFLRNEDPQHAWLKENGHKYGFRQTYTADNLKETGYVEEPWHWRYIGKPEKQTAWLFEQ